MDPSPPPFKLQSRPPALLGTWSFLRSLPNFVIWSAGTTTEGRRHRFSAGRQGAAAAPDSRLLRRRAHACRREPTFAKAPADKQPKRRGGARRLPAALQTVTLPDVKIFLPEQALICYLPL